MASKAKTSGVSFKESDWRFIDERCKELRLFRSDGKPARSLYLSMLLDLDRTKRFAKYPHTHGDGQWHLYEETQADYSAPGAVTLPAEKAVREELERRLQSASPLPPSVSGHK